MGATEQTAAEEGAALNPDLPNVLLIGDSISWGYFPYVQEALEGKANVVHAPGNNQGTTWGRQWLSRWLGATRWDLIHFNWGLHDLKHVREVDGKLENSSDPNDPPQADIHQYEVNLRLLVRQLRKTGARLIFATTTPVPKGVTGVFRLPRDVIDYNRVALMIAERNGIEVNDLYSLILPDLESVQEPRNVHFEEAGSRLMARQVADRILAKLDADR